LRTKLKAAEEAFFTAPAQGEPDTAERWTWDGETLEKAFIDRGFKTNLTLLEQQEERLLTERDLSSWFDTDHSAWGAFIAAAMGEEAFLQVRDLLRERIKQGPLVWKWKSLLLQGHKENAD
jgi:putative ATPase